MKFAPLLLVLLASCAGLDPAVDEASTLAVVALERAKAERPVIIDTMVREEKRLSDGWTWEQYAQDVKADSRPTPEAVLSRSAQLLKTIDARRGRLDKFAEAMKANDPAADALELLRPVNRAVKQLVERGKAVDETIRAFSGEVDK